MFCLPRSLYQCLGKTWLAQTGSCALSEPIPRPRGGGWSKVIGPSHGSVWNPVPPKVLKTWGRPEELEAFIIQHILPAKWEEEARTARVPLGLCLNRPVPPEVRAEHKAGMTQGLALQLQISSSHQRSLKTPGAASARKKTWAAAPNCCLLQNWLSKGTGLNRQEEESDFENTVFCSCKSYKVGPRIVQSDIHTNAEAPRKTGFSSLLPPVSLHGPSTTLLPAHSESTTPIAFLLQEHVQLIPTSEPLHLQYPLRGKSSFYASTCWAPFSQC